MKEWRRKKSDAGWDINKLASETIKRIVACTLILMALRLFVARQADVHDTIRSVIVGF